MGPQETPEGNGTPNDDDHHHQNCRGGLGRRQEVNGSSAWYAALPLFEGVGGHSSIMMTNIIMIL